ncbi:MAG: orotidine-5'-phosphate decarboxylase [Deltaproteobacteria bacterium]|nr:orotidine-5'-phosphate decarboxylase [Deltaproteobacteria bacterium]
MHWPFSARLSVRSRLIVALDTDSTDEALNIVDQLKGEVGMFKVGKPLFMHAGLQLVKAIRDRGGEVFLDLKFHDIPRTVAKAAVEATRLGVRMLDLHASGSLEMMQRTIVEVTKVCRTESLRRPKMLAVTVLTSLDPSDLGRVGISGDLEDQVVRLARLAKEAGMDGVVTSPLEIAPIREACGRGFLIVSPGVRARNAARDEQRRMLSPEAAIQAGADYLVVGRPIIEARNPVSAARDIVAAMENAMEEAGAATKPKGPKGA